MNKIENRIAALEEALNPRGKDQIRVFVSGGPSDREDGPSVATGGGQTWLREAGETMAAFKSRVERESIGVEILIFGGLPDGGLV